jgi:ATP-dependent DNA helicase RecG
VEDQELETLFNDLESDHVERKSTLPSNKEKICEAICAFANDLPNGRKPGILFIGVNDDGSCAHITVDDDLLLSLSDLRSNGNILPFPRMVVQKKVIKGCEIGVVIVEPSDDPPVRFRGRTWVRVGPRRTIATPEEERRLTEKRHANYLPFDIRAQPFSTMEDLDQENFRQTYLPASLPNDIIEQNHRTIVQQLAAMRFINRGEQGNPAATTLGLLVIGNDPRQFIPGAYVQFVRFDGRDLTDPIKDQKEIDGALPLLIRELDDTFDAHIAVATDITTQPIEVRHPDYPIVALQQLARNAVLHRTYDGTNAPVRISWFADRIEIQNPGGPYGQVTQQNFGEPGVTDYRNPHIAEAMKNLGYIQRFGIGIQLARKELAKNGNPPLEFTIEDTNVLVTLRRRI